MESELDPEQEPKFMNGEQSGSIKFFSAPGPCFWEKINNKSKEVGEGCLSFYCITCRVIEP